MNTPKIAGKRGFKYSAGSINIGTNANPANKFHASKAKNSYV
jgi:hypothetical protein